MTFIDGEPLKARLLLRGPTVYIKKEKALKIGNERKYNEFKKRRKNHMKNDPAITAPPLKVPHQ